MIKRLIDILFSFIGLLILSPVLFAFTILVWLQDGKNPFYRGLRVGKNGKNFYMLKLRSMIIGAEITGVDSTSINDKRITKVGAIVRKYKIDELFQLCNVLTGNMSLVGPRPNVERDVNIYTNIEKKILLVRPGITDFSSIVFSDEGEILKNSKDPDIDYNKLIRPWKSRLALLYINRMNLLLDIKLIFITGIALFNRKKALFLVHSILKNLTKNEELLHVVLRDEDLKPFAPPGSKKIVNNRKLMNKNYD